MKVLERKVREVSYIDDRLTVDPGQHLMTDCLIGPRRSFFSGHLTIRCVAVQVLGVTELFETVS